MLKVLTGSFDDSYVKIHFDFIAHHQNRRNQKHPPQVSFKAGMGNFFIVRGPQGSLLGPTLFSICIVDLINVSSIINFLLYADDT